MNKDSIERFFPDAFFIDSRKIIKTSPTLGFGELVKKRCTQVTKSCYYDLFQFNFPPNNPPGNLVSIRGKSFTSVKKEVAESGLPLIDCCPYQTLLTIPWLISLINRCKNPPNPRDGFRIFSTQVFEFGGVDSCVSVLCTGHRTEAMLVKADAFEYYTPSWFIFRRCTEVSD